MRHLALFTALASASAIGIIATSAERERGRLMRAPDHESFPSWRYGPNGQSGVFESETDVPNGWQDHPSKVDGAAPAGGGVQTETQPANSTTTAAAAAKTTTAKSQTTTDPATAAKTTAADGVKPKRTAKASTVTKEELEAKSANGSADALDADGHPYDANLHAGTGSKTKAGLWRMKVGVSRPAPMPGYPLDL